MDSKKNWIPSGKHFFSNLILVLIGIAFYMALSHLQQVRFWVAGVIDILMPFIVACGLAYILNRPTVYFERTLFSGLRGRRVFAILLTYLCAAALVGILLVLILPQVVQSLIGLVNNIETYLANFTAFVQYLVQEFQLEDANFLDDLMISYTDIINNVASFLRSSIPQLFNYGMAIGNLVVSAITALIASIYMLAGKEHLLTQMRKIIYATISEKRAHWFLSVCDRANSIFSGFIVGKLLDSAIIGILCFILCAILRIPLAILISVIVGFTNVIPFFGPFIGAIPSTMILLLVDPWAAIRFIVLILALQQFDGNILGPRILGDSTGLSAIWVLISIVVGGGLFGFIGMLLGVPTFAVIYTLTRDWTNKRLEEKGIDPDLITPVSSPKIPKRPRKQNRNS